MDERTLERATIGAYLVASSAVRAQRNIDRTASLRVRHELSAFRHAWRSLASQAGALGTGALGVTVLAIAYRAATSARSAAAHPAVGDVGPPAPVDDGPHSGVPRSGRRPGPRR